jgi:hypothetical protein
VAKATRKLNAIGIAGTKTLDQEAYILLRDVKFITAAVAAPSSSSSSRSSHALIPSIRLLCNYTQNVRGQDWEVHNLHAALAQI